MRPKHDIVTTLEKHEWITDDKCRVSNCNKYTNPSEVDSDVYLCMKEP